MNCTTKPQARSLDDQNLRIGYAEDDFFRNLTKKIQFLRLMFYADKAYCSGFLHL